MRETKGTCMQNYPPTQDPFKKHTAHLPLNPDTNDIPSSLCSPPLLLTPYPSLSFSSMLGHVDGLPFSDG
jgi:hypothetical protein